MGRFERLKDYWFYLKKCRNGRSIIEAFREESSLKSFELRNGISLEFDGSFRFALDVFKEIFKSKVYIKNCDFEQTSIIDIGGHFGFFAIQAASL